MLSLELVLPIFITGSIADTSVVNNGDKSDIRFTALLLLIPMFSWCIEAWKDIWGNGSYRMMEFLEYAKTFCDNTDKLKKTYTICHTSGIVLAIILLCVILPFEWKNWTLQLVIMVVGCIAAFLLQSKKVMILLCKTGRNV